MFVEFFYRRKYMRKLLAVLKWGGMVILLFCTLVGFSVVGGMVAALFH